MLDTQNAQTTKQRIMDAAEDVVVKMGAAHLTFDELVRQTGLSKGGILYHYPSKEILLRAMVQRMITGFDRNRQRAVDKIEQTGLVGAKSYILASFDSHDREQATSTTLMAAAASDPELLAVVREHYKANFDEIRAAGNKSTLAMILFLAADGLWLLDGLQLCPLNKGERQALKDMMMKLADA